MNTNERAEELAHGGLISRTGNLVTLGDGAQWWLNGTDWARQEADALIAIDRTSHNLRSPSQARYPL